MIDLNSSMIIKEITLMTLIFLIITIHLDASARRLWKPSRVLFFIPLPTKVSIPVVFATEQQTIIVLSPRQGPRRRVGTIRPRESDSFRSTSQSKNQSPPMRAGRFFIFYFFNFSFHISHFFFFIFESDRAESPRRVGGENC